MVPVGAAQLEHGALSAAEKLEVGIMQNEMGVCLARVVPAPVLGSGAWLRCVAPVLGSGSWLRCLAPVLVRACVHVGREIAFCPVAPNPDPLLRDSWAPWRGWP